MIVKSSDRWKLKNVFSLLKNDDWAKRSKTNEPLIHLEKIFVVFQNIFRAEAYHLMREQSHKAHPHVKFIICTLKWKICSNKVAT